MEARCRAGEWLPFVSALSSVVANGRQTVQSVSPTRAKLPYGGFFPNTASNEHSEAPPSSPRPARNISATLIRNWPQLIGGIPEAVFQRRIIRIFFRWGVHCMKVAELYFKPFHPERGKDGRRVGARGLQESREIAAYAGPVPSPGEVFNRPAGFPEGLRQGSSNSARSRSPLKAMLSSNNAVVEGDLGGHQQSRLSAWVSTQISQKSWQNGIAYAIFGLINASPDDIRKAAVADARRTLESAADFTRGGGAPAPDHDADYASRAGRIEAEQRRLIQWAEENGKLGSSGRLPPVFAQGGEHDVFFQKRTQRYLKATRQDRQ